MKTICNLLFTKFSVVLVVAVIFSQLYTSTGCQGTKTQHNLSVNTDPDLAEQVKLIGNLENPAGVNPVMWQKLTSRLSLDLQTYYFTSDRLVSTAPASEGSRTTLSIIGNTLSWGYYNQADYDQNGEVNLADLTAIALNIGTTGPFDENSALAVIDGDGNTEINLSDITPIAVNFRYSTLGGYNIYQSMDMGDLPASNAGPNGAGAILVGNSPFDTGTGNTAIDRVQFGFDLAEPVVNAYYWVRPTDGTEEGTPSNLVQVLPPPNIDPIAIVTAIPDTGDYPLVVSFDGTLSSDPDGEIVDYSWDYDGAIGGLNWVSTGLVPTFEHTYLDAGTFLALLKVTDNEGASINNFVTIVISETPNDLPVANLTANPTSGVAPLMVDFDASSSNDPDGEIVKFEWDWDGDGTYELDSGTVNIADHEYVTPGDYPATVRITDNLGATDTRTLLISVLSVNPEWHISTIRNDLAFDGIDLALINGRPACAISDNQSENKIFYYYANDALGATWPDPLEIGHANADWLTLVTVEDKPAVIYRYDGNTGGYNIAEDANGDVWDKEVSIDPGFSLANITSRWAGAVIDGKPSLGYKGEIAGDDGLYYQSATSAAGTTWNSPRLVFAADLVSYPALHEVNGRPAMIFADESGVLIFARAADTEGSSWPAPTVVVPDSNVLMFPEIATVNGNPAILFPSRETFNSVLSFVSASDANGESWNTPESLYSNLDFPPAFPSLAVVGGNPTAVWGGANPNDLLYVRANDQAGTSWEPGERVDIYFNSPLPMAEINGHPAIAYLRNGIVSADLMFAIYY